MKRSRFLWPINVVLAVVVVAVLLGCGSDPVDPPKGSLEAKLKGSWEADPRPPAEGEKAIWHTTHTIRISYFTAGSSRPNGMATHAFCDFRPPPKDVPKPESKETSIDMGEFNYDGLTATTDGPREDGTWVLRLDADDPSTLYVTWTLADGTKRLDEVPFRKKR